MNIKVFLVVNIGSFIEELQASLHQSGGSHFTFKKVDVHLLLFNVASYDHGSKTLFRQSGHLELTLNQERMHSEWKWCISEHGSTTTFSPLP